MKKQISPAVAVVAIIVVIAVIVGIGFLFAGRNNADDVDPESGVGSTDDTMAAEQAIIDQGMEPGVDDTGVDAEAETMEGGQM